MPEFRLWGNGGPHRGQAPVWTLRHRIARGEGPRTVFLPCGPRWGKDRLSVWLALAVAFDLASKRDRSGLVPRVHCWIVAPHYSLGQQLWRELLSFTAPLLPEVEKAERRVVLPGDIVIELRSADNPASLDGVGLDVLIVSEAAMVSDEAWAEHLVHRLVSPGRLGLAIVNGTPGIVPSEWYAKLWRRAEDGDPGVLMVNEPSWANPHLEAAQLQEIERARHELPERLYRTSFGAELLPWDSGVFAHVRECSTAKPEEPEPGGEYVTFADLGHSVDFTAVCVLRVDGKLHERPRQVHADRFNKLDWPIARERIAAVGRRYPGSMALDTTGGPFGEELAREVQRLVGDRTQVSATKFTASNKEPMVMHLMQRLESREIELLHPETSETARIQLVELSEYQAKKLPSGAIRYEAPSGRHDDMAVAVFGAAWLAKEAVSVQTTLAIMKRFQGSLAV